MNREEKMRELDLFRKNYMNELYSSPPSQRKEMEKNLQNALRQKAKELNLKF